MIKTAEYVRFEEGFIQEAVESGCDEQFLRGYIKEADTIVDTWRQAFDELAIASGDPNYRVKLANDLIYFSLINKGLDKQAAPGDIGSQLGTFLGQTASKLGMGDAVAKFFADPKNQDFFKHMSFGGAGGGLIGLLLGALMGHPAAGLMAGGLGGAAFGAAYNQGYLSNLFGGQDNQSGNSTADHTVDQKPGPTQGMPGYLEGDASLGGPGSHPSTAAGADPELASQEAMRQGSSSGITAATSPNAVGNPVRDDAVAQHQSDLTQRGEAVDNANTSTWDSVVNAGKDFGHSMNEGAQSLVGAHPMGPITGMGQAANATGFKPMVNGLIHGAQSMTQGLGSGINALTGPKPLNIK